MERGTLEGRFRKEAVEGRRPRFVALTRLRAAPEANPWCRDGDDHAPPAHGSFHALRRARARQPEWKVLDPGVPDDAECSLTAHAVMVWQVPSGGAALRRFLAAASLATRNLSLAALLLMLCMSSARAACLHWGKTAPLQNPSESLVFAGTLGQRRIRMRLHLDPATGRMDGAYGYNNEPGTLQLVGYMLKNGSGVNLVELGKTGKVTAFFDLSFSPPTNWLGGSVDPRKENRAAFEKQWNKYWGECESLTGIWGRSMRPGTAAKAVVVQQAGTLDPKDKKARLVNEATAYAFMQAFMHNDRKKVVSLLHYPFHSYGQFNTQNVVRTWKTPESVLKNYAEIMQFESKYLRTRVPHVLLTDDGLTEFMHGSLGLIELYEGKITWICSGSCPVMTPAQIEGKESF